MPTMFLCQFLKASFYGYVDIVNELIKAHANVDLKHSTDFTALMLGIITILN